MLWLKFGTIKSYASQTQTLTLGSSETLKAVHCRVRLRLRGARTTVTSSQVTHSTLRTGSLFCPVGITVLTECWENAEHTPKCCHIALHHNLVTTEQLGLLNTVNKTVCLHHSPVNKAVHNSNTQNYAYHDIKEENTSLNKLFYL